MKHIILSIIIVLTVLPQLASAQFTIKDGSADEQVRPLEIKDPILVSPQPLEPLVYKTEAMRIAEKKQRRKDRNYIEITPTLGMSHSNYTNWAKGGDDMFSGQATLYLKYEYKNSKLTVTNIFDAALGLDIIDTIRFKSSDKFDLRSGVKWAINRRWSYAGDVRIRSQFMTGYKNRKDKTYVSNFMSPATFTIAFGFTYKPFQTENLNITMSPIAGEALIVKSELLSNKGTHMEKGKHFRPSIGPQLAIQYDKKIMWKEKEVGSYRMDFTSFYNLRYSPNVLWNNYLTFKPLKFLSIKYDWFVIYDEGIMTKDMTGYMQFSSKLTLNLTYTFKNK